MRLRLAALAFALVSLTACGGGGLGKLFGLPAIPTASPAPAIQVTPTSVTLSVGATATITASENSSSAFFTAQSSDATVATVAQSTSQNAFIITAMKSGSCKVLISDTYGSTVTIPVTVH